VSSPASSGPAGPHFEGQVGAYYLLALLAGSEVRGLPGCTVDRVRLQGAPEGHALDDVIVQAHDGSGKIALLEIQVKRSIDFTPSDEVFAAVMEQVARAVLVPDFLNSRTELAVATSQHSRQIDGAYQDVLTWAREFGDAVGFHKRLALPRVANLSMRTFVSTFRAHLRRNGAPDDDVSVWRLLRRFQILVFDFTAKGSSAEDLARERAVRVLPPGQEHKASDLWRLLIERSIQVAASGGERTREELHRDFADSFQFAPLKRHHEALLRLEELSRQVLDDIETRVAGVRLSRQAYVEQLSEALDQGRYIDIRGDAGVGKSGILRHFAEQLSIQSRVIVLSPNRTYTGGWPGMRLALNFNGTCKELLSELSANGGGAIFIDNLDFYREDERPMIVTLLREAVSIPGLVVITTSRRSFGTSERSWLPESALDQLGRTATVSIGEIGDADIDELLNAAPQLSQLLSGSHPAREVVRNLFCLSRLAERPTSETLPRTEAEMATEWWRQAGSHEVLGRRDRARFLKALTEHLLASPGAFDSSGIASQAIDALILNETLLELRTDAVVFRHDVFREWAVACLLFDDSNKIAQLPCNKLAPPDLGRAIELLARMRIESAMDTAAWQDLLVIMSAPKAHASWRRFVLLALVRSEASSSALDTVAPLLVHDKSALLCELIRLTMAVDVEPARARFAAAGVDGALIPESMNMPSGLSWLRLIAWLVYRLRNHLPHEAITDVVKLYSGWCFSFMGVDSISAAIVEQMYRWLREIEIAREQHPYWGDPGVFSGAIKGDDLKSLEESLRFTFIAFAYQAPRLAAEYLESFKTRTHCEYIKIGVLQFRGSLAQAAPAQLVDFTLSTLIPKEKKPERGRHTGLRDEPFGFNDGKFLPCSPAQGPFFELLTHSPQNGLRLIRQLIDYSISFETGGRDPGGDSIAIQFSGGPRFFPWVNTYLWSREAYGGPYLVTSALMALEAWAHRRLDNAESFEEVLTDLIGEPGGPAAYLLPAVDIILSHWPDSMVAAVPFVAAPDLLTVDRRRYAADSMPGFPKLPIMLELEELQKEPAGPVRAGDLKKRRSRRLMLDQVLGNYALQDSEPGLRRTLRGLLEDAAKPLAPFTEHHTFADPEFMIIHALNAIEPENWRMETLPTTDGGTGEYLVYVPPAAEAAHQKAMEAKLRKRHPRDLRAEIEAAWRDSNRATPEFLVEALMFVQDAEAGDQPGDDETRFRMPVHEQNAITVAVLVTRLGSVELRQEHDAWIRTTLASSFSDQEKETHRHRSECQFNPQAISFLGYVLLLKVDKSADNIRLLLAAASFSNPSASVGFKDAALELAKLDERLIRSILRCAFTARIVPGRDWQMVRPEQRELQQVECAKNLAARIDEEIAWVTAASAEPAWPQFPVKRPYLRNGFRRRDSDAEVENENKLVDVLDFEDYGAAQWLKAAESLFDVSTRPWLRELVECYSDWTIIANGNGIPKGEQIDGEPDSWNEAFLQLAADCLPELALEDAGSLMSLLFGQLPDEALFGTLPIFLGEIDELFFNRRSISFEMAVSLRTLASALLRATRGWKRLQSDRTLSSETKISGVVAKFYFNTSGGGFLPSKCYLNPIAIPRITPFLKLFQDFALDGQCPLHGLLVLNIIEVAPSAEHLGFLISVGSAWITIYQDSLQFWSEYQFGKRLCNLLQGILSHSRPQSSPAELQALDRLLGHLVRLGLPEAHRAEESLRYYAA
jgi:hypothetical protein